MTRRRGIRIPKRVKVGGRVYRVREGYAFKERSDADGMCDGDTLEIRLAGVANGNCPLAPAVVEETFIHELLHAVDETYNAGAMSRVSHDSLTCIACGLYQVLCDNKILRTHRKRG